MKKIITIFLFFIAFTFYAQVEENIYFSPKEIISNSKKTLQKVSLRGDDFIQDSTYRYYYDQSIQDYLLLSRNIFNYNDAGQTTLDHWQQFDEASSSFLDGGSKEEYTYDAQGNLIQHLNLHYDSQNDIWQADFNLLYTYENQNLVEEISQLWDFNLNALKNRYRTTNYYNAAGLLDSVSLEKYDDIIPNDWNFVWKYNYTYNLSEKISSYIFQRWDPQTDLWNNESKGIYDYDAVDNRIKITFQEWLVGSNMWSDSERWTWVYNSFNNPIQYKRQIPNGNLWFDVSIELYTYDANQNRTEALRQNMGATDWINSWKENFSYDENDNQIQKLGYCWQCDPDNTEVWTSGEREDYFWSKFFSNNINTSESNEVSCTFPNPFQNRNILKCNFENNKNYTLLLYDIQGRLNFKSQLKNSQSLSTSNDLGHGLYFLLIQDEEKNLFREKIIIK